MSELHVVHVFLLYINLFIFHRLCPICYDVFFGGIFLFVEKTKLKNNKIIMPNFKTETGVKNTNWILLKDN